MDKFFSIFGKIVIILFFLGAMGAVGYYLGTKKPELLTSVTPTPTPAAQATPAVKQNRVVKGGLPASAKLSYSTYTILVPEDWTTFDQKDQTTPTDKLTISKDNYQISIYQAATGGAQCLYPGDSTPEGPSGTYGSYTEFVGSDKTTYRRGTIDSTKIATQNFGICAKAEDGSFGEPTQFGHILYQTPKTFDPAILDQMDKIVASLTKTP